MIACGTHAARPGQSPWPPGGRLVCRRHRCEIAARRPGLLSPSVEVPASTSAAISLTLCPAALPLPLLSSMTVSLMRHLGCSVTCSGQRGGAGRGSQSLHDQQQRDGAPQQG